MRATVFKPLGAALLALLLVWAAAHSRPWHALEFRSFDLWTTLAAPGRSSVPVAILAIDEPSFQQLGQGWPFPRSLHARLIDRLREDGARAIGFDVVFADPAADPAQDAALAQAVGRAVAAGIPVVLASSREKVDSASAADGTSTIAPSGICAAVSRPSARNSRSTSSSARRTARTSSPPLTIGTRRRTGP